MKLAIRETEVMGRSINIDTIFSWLAKRFDELTELTSKPQASTKGALTTEEASSFQLPDNKVNLISIGRFSFQKGYDILLQSFALLENRKDYHLTLIGNGDLKEDYIRFIKEYKLEEEVSIIDFTDNPFYYLNHADLFISSSRWEAIPNVVLESLACGTPVISSPNKRGINEIIKEGVNGYICDYSNPEEFNQILEKAKETNWNRSLIKNQLNTKWSQDKTLAQYSNLSQAL